MKEKRNSNIQGIPRYVALPSPIPTTYLPLYLRQLFSNSYTSLHFQKSYLKINCIVFPVTEFLEYHEKLDTTDIITLNLCVPWVEGRGG